MTMTDKALQDLNVYCVRFLNAQQSADIAKKQQSEAKFVIANLVPANDKTQRTVTLLDGAKLVVKRGFNTKVDVQGIITLCANDPDFIGLPAPVESTITHSLDAKGYEWYRVNHPKLFVKIAQFVTLKPREVGVTITPRKEDG